MSDTVAANAPSIKFAIDGHGRALAQFADEALAKMPVDLEALALTLTMELAQHATAAAMRAQWRAAYAAGKERRIVEAPASALAGLNGGGGERKGLEWRS